MWLDMCSLGEYTLPDGSTVDRDVYADGESGIEGFEEYCRDRVNLNNKDVGCGVSVGDGACADCDY